MANLTAARPEYDASRDFVVVRREGLKASGKLFAQNETFDKSLVSERTLRQLYEQRALAISNPEGLAFKTPQRSRQDAERQARIARSLSSGKKRRRGGAA